MSAKRALIVDDSKSARAFLARILERYELAVDTAENAEQAIEYLTRSQPDVIFMDHLMPGMDGFQAVQSIKNNPRTAMIPIMMYTSQEGELYLGQARALGAIGVMPKQIRPADVSKVLYQLKLLPDRRGGDQTSFTPANATALSATPPAPAIDTGSSATLNALTLGAEIRQMVDSVVREQLADLRRGVAVALDKQSERLLGDFKAAVTELPPPVMPPWPEPAPAAPRRAGWVAAALVSVVAAVLGFVWWQEAQQSNQLAAQLVSLQQRVRAVAPAATVTPVAPLAKESPALVAQRAATRAADESSDLMLLVPYGEVPLAGERIESVRTTVNDMARRRVQAAVTLVSFPGRFCLLGNPGEGYAPAPDELLFSKCDLVGNPFDDALGAAQREPVSIANLRASARRDSAGLLAVQLANGRADAAAVAYPPISDKLTAGEWNRAATANNRLELRLRSTP